MGGSSSKAEETDDSASAAPAIEVKPTQQQAPDRSKPLRFAVGDRVECNCSGWRQGTVVTHWWRDSKWPPEKIVPYQIKLDYGPTIFAPKDDDKCIRAIQGLLSDGQIPVTILTGFLGAGKTTLLNYILTAQHGKKYAIIENEFGAVSIDDQLLNQAVGKQETVESISVLDNGCLCCTIRDDLVLAIKNIIEKVEERYQAGVTDAKLDGILIETTGMADPGPIINIFGKDPTCGKYTKIDGVLTVVDCKHFLTQLHRERDDNAVNESAQQVGFADKVLLNKIDVCSRDYVNETTGAIRGINSFVPIIECSLSKKPDAVPLGELLAIEAFDSAKLLSQQTGQDEVNLIQAAMEKSLVLEDDHGGHGGGHGDGHGAGHEGGHDPDCADDSHGHGEGGHSAGAGHGSGHSSGHSGGHGHSANRHDTEVKSMVLEKDGSMLVMSKFQAFLAKILEERSVDLYRYKGVLAARQRDGNPCLYILQGVHDMPEMTFSGVWPQGKPIKTQVVIIGRKLEMESYREQFEACFDADAPTFANV
jgi:G3E family GTPase